MVLLLLNIDVRELIKADIITANIRPLRPVGSKVVEYFRFGRWYDYGGGCTQDFFGRDVLRGK